MRRIRASANSGECRRPFFPGSSRALVSLSSEVDSASVVFPSRSLPSPFDVCQSNLWTFSLATCGHTIFTALLVRDPSSQVCPSCFSPLFLNFPCSMRHYVYLSCNSETLLTVVCSPRQHCSILNNYSVFAAQTGWRRRTWSKLIYQRSTPALRNLKGSTTVRHDAHPTRGNSRFRLFLALIPFETEKKDKSMGNYRGL